MEKSKAKKIEALTKALSQKDFSGIEYLNKYRELPLFAVFYFDDNGFYDNKQMEKQDFEDLQKYPLVGIGFDKFYTSENEYRSRIEKIKKMHDFNFFPPIELHLPASHIELNENRK